MPRAAAWVLVAIAACRGDAPGPQSSSPLASIPASVTAVSPASAPASQPGAPAASAHEGPWDEQVLTWSYPDSPVGKTSVVVVSPKTSERLPLLIALHGLGEAEKGPMRGARGWVDDYGLLTALGRIAKPPLTRADMQQLGTAEHLRALNAELAARPYRGLVIVCPYTPDIIGGTHRLDAAQALGRFLTEEVLPRALRELPVLGAPSATGIDGVSLGGRAALLVGLEHADRFGVVGSMQAAIYADELDELAERVEGARAAHPAMVLRLLTSSADFYREPIASLSKRLRKRSIEHAYTVVGRGPHSYEFNRGLGAYEMLLFHDRALRGEAE